MGNRKKFLKMNPDFVGRYEDVESKVLFLRAWLMGRKMWQGLRALSYMLDKHAEQKRRGGLPYVIHPLGMALHAVSIDDPNIDDELIAILLLHDVCEDCKVRNDELPFDDAVRRGVQYMSLVRFDSETKFAMKQRYYWELSDHRRASIGKGFDRYDNLRTMGATFEPDKIRKNVVETNMLLLPSLERAEEKWCEASNLLRLLRTGIRDMNDIYAAMYNVWLTDKNYINPADAVDYTKLLTEPV